MKLLIAPLLGLFIAGCLVLYAYARTWGKTDLEVIIHINEQQILQSVYGESPTFAIWIENPETKENQTIFVTERAGLDDWEGKSEVPSALPLWDEVCKNKKQAGVGVLNIDAISGATPKPGYFTTRVQVPPGSKWICWVEMNLSGDYNEHYPEYDETNKKTDNYGTGQPALVYKGYIEVVEGNTVVPELVGMSILNKEGECVKPVEGITTAQDVFDKITISIVKPKPRIL